jgi:hypothetical protein
MDDERKLLLEKTIAVKNETLGSVKRFHLPGEVKLHRIMHRVFQQKIQKGLSNASAVQFPPVKVINTCQGLLRNVSRSVLFRVL